jgi:hypothetical protein
VKSCGRFDLKNAEKCPWIAPWHERKAQTVVDHGEAARCQREAPQRGEQAVLRNDVLTLPGAQGLACAGIYLTAPNSAA